MFIVNELALKQKNTADGLERNNVCQFLDTLSELLSSLDALEKVENIEETSKRSIAEWVIEYNIPLCHVLNIL